MATGNTTALQQLQLIHIMLVAGAVSVTGVLVFMGLQGMGPGEKELGDMLGWISVALAAGARVGGSFIKQNMLGGLTVDTPLDKKINTYRTATIVQLAMAEGSAAIGAVAYFMGETLIGLLVAFVMIGWMVMLRPTADRMQQEAHLSRAEVDKA